MTTLALGACAQARDPSSGASDARPVDRPDSAQAADAAIGDAATRADAGPPDAHADATVDTVDAGPLVFFEETFDAGLGAFTASTVCGSSPPAWSTSGGYAHASEPGGTGVSRIASASATVPAGATHVMLQVTHAFNTEDGYDGGQLYVAVNGGPYLQVTTFASGGYTNGVHANPVDCSVTGSAKNQYPGWSGSAGTVVSEVDLAAPPWNAAPGAAISIALQMSSDNSQSGSGWDIDRVRLVGQ